MKTKKSQQELIVTVLLVLIALVAVVIISTFIIRYVRQGTAAAAGKANCAKIDLQIVAAQAGQNKMYYIKRNDNNADIGISSVSVVYMTNIATNLIVNATPSPPLTPLAVSNVSAPATGTEPGKEILLNVILSDGTSCADVASFRLTP